MSQKNSIIGNVIKKLIARSRSGSSDARCLIEVEDVNGIFYGDIQTNAQFNMGSGKDAGLKG